MVRDGSKDWWPRFRLVSMVSRGKRGEGGERQPFVEDSGRLSCGESYRDRRNGKKGRKEGKRRKEGR
jgi:hypothetical protein